LSNSFFAELKRRNVFKVAFGYILLGWVVLQVADVIVPTLGLPEWTMKFLLVVGALGFPFAIFFAWAFELTPDGIKKEVEIKPEESITAHTGQKLNYAIIVLLAFSLSYFVYESRFKTAPDEANVSITTTESDNAPAENSTLYAGTSIAVLPFVNMSSDPEQEYFSDGISEEILNVLAKIPNLQVTSRSSAFAFKGQQINISKVAETLGVKHVLEGSVRKSNNRVRITAQLIEADTDVHLWSETYDRELNDIFAIQDEISAAIVSALKDNLGLNATVANKSTANINLDAHNEYLQGKFFVEQRKPEAVQKALGHFNAAIAIDPNYAPAWMGKAWATHFSSEFSYGTMPVSMSQQLALQAINKALELDPLLPDSHAIKGLIIDFDGTATEEADEHFKRALELNPNYSDAYTWLAGGLVNEPKLRLEMREKAVRLNPMSILSNVNYGYSLVDFGRLDDAFEVAEHIRSIEPNAPRLSGLLSVIYFQKGEVGKAVYYMRERAKSTNAVQSHVALAFNLYRLGLPELGKNYLTHPEHKHLIQLLTGNAELYINSSSAIFPRGESDSLGYFILGEIEIMRGNYANAINHFEKSFCTECAYIIYAYQQVNDTDMANAIIMKLKAGLQQRTAEGENGLEAQLADLAYLENDINSAVDLFYKAVSKGQLLGFDVDIMPMYEALRAHPDWPKVVALNKAIQEEQSAIYLQLVADNP